MLNFTFSDVRLGNDSDSNFANKEILKEDFCVMTCFLLLESLRVQPGSIGSRAAIDASGPLRPPHSRFSTFKSKPVTTSLLYTDSVHHRSINYSFSGPNLRHCVLRRGSWSCSKVESLIVSFCRKRPSPCSN